MSRTRCRTGTYLPELARRRAEAAARPGAGKPWREVLARVETGADLVAYWQAAGLVGSRPDIADSQAEARRLREQAQCRGG
ncbi:MAG: hypothetical protein C0501_06130 [Isosphaera sp.]|nr:hypothetical protein [Isosphaera sp.]